MSTKQYGKEVSWVFGSCSGPEDYKEYEDNKEYDVNCCQPAGKYDLKCTDAYGDGWNSGFIQIGSSQKKLCADSFGKDKTVSNVAHKGSNTAPKTDSVCVNLKLTTKRYAKEISWEFGKCSGPGNWESGPGKNYPTFKTITIECCQPPGDYEMKCMDSHGDGWNGGFIQVGSSPDKLCTGKFKEKSTTVKHPANP